MNELTPDEDRRPGAWIPDAVGRIMAWAIIIVVSGIVLSLILGIALKGDVVAALPFALGMIGFVVCLLSCAFLIAIYELRR